MTYFGANLQYYKIVVQQTNSNTFEVMQKLQSSQLLITSELLNTPSHRFSITNFFLFSLFFFLSFLNVLPSKTCDNNLDAATCVINCCLLQLVVAFTIFSSNDAVLLESSFFFILCLAHLSSQLLDVSICLMLNVLSSFYCIE